MNKALHTDNAPAAIGPYSQAVQAEKTIYVSGQLPVDPATGEFAGEDIKAQTKQSLTNIKNILASAGADMSDVTKTTVLHCRLWSNERSICRIFHRTISSTRSFSGCRSSKGRKSRD